MEAAGQLMQCMEVWGGSDIVDKTVAMPGLDAWVYCKPYRDAEGGGDIYYVSSCATGRITRLLVADVSGHGAAVRDTATALREMMRRYVNHIDQSSFVRSLNRQFAALSDAGTFATALVTTFFGPTRYLTLCNAGHPPPLLFRAASREWSYLEQQGNIPLGIDDVIEYAQFGVQLAVNDVVLCYTDSLIEAHNESGEMLGREGLLKVVKQIEPTEPSVAIPELLARISVLSPKNLTEDDVTVLLFRPNGKAKSASFLKRALAPLRVLGAIPGAMMGKAPMPWPEFSLANLGGAMFQPLRRRASTKASTSSQNIPRRS